MSCATAAKPTEMPFGVRMDIARPTVENSGEYPECGGCVKISDSFARGSSGGI